MARKRMISPEIWDSQDFGLLSSTAKLLWIGIFSLADDEGRGRANLTYLKSKLFSYIDMETEVLESAVREIAENMSIVFYKKDRGEYYQLTKWDMWQSIQKPTDSRFPTAETADCFLYTADECRADKLSCKADTEQKADCDADVNEQNNIDNGVNGASVVSNAVNLDESSGTYSVAENSDNSDNIDKMQSNNGNFCESSLTESNFFIPNSDYSSTTVGLQYDYNSTTVGLQPNIKEKNIKEININKRNSSSELLQAQEPNAISLTLNDGSEFVVCQSDIDDWGRLYPSLDIMQQLRNMKGWIIANPQRRKTKKGIAKFIHGWLAREQNSYTRSSATFGGVRASASVLPEVFNDGIDHAEMERIIWQKLSNKSA